VKALSLMAAMAADLSADHSEETCIAFADKTGPIVVVDLFIVSDAEAESEKEWEPSR